MSRALFGVTLRRYWWAIVGMALLGGVAAVAVHAAVPKRFEANAVILLSTPQVSDPTESSTYIRDRMPTYAALFTSRPILDNARRLLGLDQTAPDLSGQIQATVEQSTVLVTLSARWTDGQGAADVANAVARSYADLGPALDNSPGAVLRADVIEPAVPPVSPVGLSTITSFAMGLVAGLTVALVGALGWGAYRPTARDIDDIAAATDSDVLGVLFLSNGSTRPVPRRHLFANWRTRLARQQFPPSTPEMVYSRLGLAALPTVNGQPSGESPTVADGPHMILVLSTENGPDAALVALSLASICRASGQRCLIVAGGDNVYAALSRRDSARDALKGRRLAEPEVLHPSATNTGAVLRVDELTAELQVASSGVDLILIAAEPIDENADTRSLLALGGDVLLATPPWRCRLKALRSASERVRKSGAEIKGVVVVASQQRESPVAPSGGGPQHRMSRTPLPPEPDHHETGPLGKGQTSRTDRGYPTLETVSSNGRAVGGAADGI